LGDSFDVENDEETGESGVGSWEGVSESREGEEGRSVGEKREGEGTKEGEGGRR